MKYLKDNMYWISLLFVFIVIIIIMLKLYTKRSEELEYCISNSSIKAHFISKYKEKVIERCKNEVLAYKILSSIWEIGIIKYNLSPDLLFSLIDKENSEWDPHIISKVNSNFKYNGQGLMQITPPTAKIVAENIGIKEYSLLNAEDNIELGCYLLRTYIDMYGIEDALRYWYAGSWSWKDPVLVKKSLAFARDVQKGRKKWK